MLRGFIRNHCLSGPETQFIFLSRHEMACCTKSKFGFSYKIVYNFVSIESFTAFLATVNVFESRLNEEIV